MSPDEFQKQFESVVRSNVTVLKIVRRKLWTIFAVNLVCLLISLTGIACVLLGCLKLFGVI
jgi:hypothetical protein